MPIYSNTHAYNNIASLCLYLYSKYCDISNKFIQTIIKPITKESSNTRLRWVLLILQHYAYRPLFE